MVRVVSLAVGVLGLVLAGRVQGQTNGCNLNPGGPDGLVLTVPAGGTDFDLGWKGGYHNFAVPRGAEFSLCLSGCDTSTDPVCDVQGYASGQQVSGRAFWPPLPIAIGSTAACAVTTFQEPFATGTANVQTGAVDLTAGLSADVYLTALNNVCPVCTGTTPGEAGICSGGVADGQLCTTDEVITVENATAGNPYRVSRDCLPSGAPLSVAATVNVSTGTVTQSGLCPGQTSPNNCGVGACGATCTGAVAGIHQNCCSNNTSRACFPDPVSRTGSAAGPTPAWPDPSYPKLNSATLVSVFCAPGAPGIIGLGVNSNVGLPGPSAFILPVDAVWQLDPAPTVTTTSSSTSTTSSSTSTTTSTLPPCIGPADCADSDSCTDDVCANGACSNPPATGTDGAICQVAGLADPGLCGADTIDPNTAAAITQAVAKATTALQQSKTASAKKAKGLRKAAQKALKAVGKKATKAAKKQAITAACRDTIKQTIASLTQLIAGL